MKNIVFILILISLTGCTTFDMILHPSEYQKKNYSIIEKRLVYDTVSVHIDNQDNSFEPVAGVLPKRSFTLSKIGDRITFKKGEPIELISDNIDFNRASIQVITDETKDEVTLVVSDQQLNVVDFQKKCECIEVRNTTQIPPIELNPKLDPHQIIITPIFSNCPDCVLIGYQIRYGDQQLGGCWNEAKEVYDKFKCCLPKYNPNSSIMKEQRKTKDFYKIMFGKSKSKK
jgi:hypothetical protein